MSDYSDIAAGVRTTLEAANSKLTVYVTPPPNVLEYPCIVVEPPEEINYDLDFGDNSWSQLIPLTLSVRHGQATEGWNELYKYLSPTGTESVKRGQRTDTTLSSKVDDSLIEGVRNIGRDPQEDGGQQVFGAQFLLRVWETVT